MTDLTLPGTRVMNRATGEFGTVDRIVRRASGFYAIRPAHDLVVVRLDNRAEDWVEFTLFENDYIPAPKLFGRFEVIEGGRARVVEIHPHDPSPGAAA